MEIRISNSFWGWLLVLGLFGLILVLGWRSITKMIKFQQDLGAAYSGRVIERKMETGFKDDLSIPECYLVIETASGSIEKRYCRFEGYSRCKVGEIIVKKPGRKNIPLPLGEKPMNELLDEAVPKIRDSQLKNDLKRVKQYYNYD